MRLKNIILLVLFIALSSCAKQELGDNPGGVPKDGVRINYSLPVATVVETRSGKVTDETAINSMHILVFEDNAGVADKFVEIRQATIYADGSALVKLASSEGAKRIVRIVANADAIITAAGDIFDPATATWATISAAMKVGTITVDASGVPTALPTTPLPMFSDEIKLDKIEPGVTSIGGTTPVVLKSGYAKVSLTSTDIKLVVSGIALHNAPAVGGSLFATTPTASATKAHYHKTAITNTPNYLFPTSVTADDKIDLIIKGRYDNEATDTYYRISLSKAATTAGDQNRTYFNIEANYHYAVTLTSVGVCGYPSIEEAINNPYSNIIYDTDTDMGDNNGMASNGQYCMQITNTTYKVTTAGAGVIVSKLTTDAPATTQRSVQIVSSVSDGEFLVKDVAIGVDGNITATTANIGGAAVVRVTVGNLSQDITITNVDNPVTLVDTDQEAYLTAASVGDIACSFSTELSDKLGLAITQPTGMDALKKGKVTLNRKDVLHTGLKYIGKIAVTDAKAKVSYSVPVTIQMYSVNVGGTLEKTATRGYKKGGLNWATGDLTMTNIGSYLGMMVSVDPTHMDGMYFKWMTEWGGKGLNPPFSDGSDRPESTIPFLTWASISPGVTGAVGDVKYDPCYNAGEIPGKSLGTGDRRKRYWRSPTEAEVISMVSAGTHTRIEAGVRVYVNGRIKLRGYRWLDQTAGFYNNNLGGIWIDGVNSTSNGRFIRPEDNTYHWLSKNQGYQVRCVKVNTRK